MAGHNLHIAGLLDAYIGVEALVGHGCLYDLPFKLNLHLDGGLVQAVKVCGLGFHDFVAAQGERPGGCNTVLVRLDGVHQVARPSIVDLKLRAGDGGAGGPAVDTVVVRGGLCYLDLSSDRGVLPLHLGGFPRLHIDGLFLRVGNVPLVL